MQLFMPTRFDWLMSFYYDFQKTEQLKRMVYGVQPSIILHIYNFRVWIYLVFACRSLRI